MLPNPKIRIELVTRKQTFIVSRPGLFSFCVFHYMFMLFCQGICQEIMNTIFQCLTFPLTPDSWLWDLRAPFNLYSYRWSRIHKIGSNLHQPWRKYCCGVVCKDALELPDTKKRSAGATLPNPMKSSAPPRTERKSLDLIVEVEGEAWEKSHLREVPQTTTGTNVTRSHLSKFRKKKIIGLFPSLYATIVKLS